MAKAIIIPKLGLTMEKATLTTWMKQEGDSVEKGEPLCIIETDKVTFEIEAPQSGVLFKIMADEGSVLPVGEVIAIIAQEGEEFKLDELIKQVKDERTFFERRPSEAPIAILASSGRGRDIKASPLARRIAEEKGVSLEGIVGTGPGGSITKDDVLRASEEQSLQVSPLIVSRRISLKGIRKVVAERMISSWHTSPSVTQVMEVDMTEAVRFREEHLTDWESKGVRVSLNDLLIKVVSQALVEHPEINASLKGDEIQVYGNVNIGIAVDTDRGLIVPVLKNAHQKSLLEIARESRLLIQKTQEGKIDLDDLSFGTFTITNLGNFGIDLFTPIIHQPESAILGIGKLDRKAKVLDGEKIDIRWAINLCLTFDHRVINGAPAARFLARLKEIFESSIQLREFA